jgi:LPXTG-motif cell wall-anchored protein
VSVTPGQGPLGTQITVSGSGCPAGVTDVVAIRIEGASDDVAPWDPAAPDAFRFSTPPAADGSFSLAFAVPSDLPLGENSVQVFCISEGGSNLAGPGFGLFVVTEAPAAPAPPLPRTGGGASSLVLAAVVLLGVGLLCARGSRRNPRRPERPA